MAQFPYVSLDNLPTSLMPRLPLTLIFGENTVDVTGLLDTGAAVSVLPYRFGLALGARWEEQTLIVPLVASLGQFEARALVVRAFHPQINPDRSFQLAFAWTQAENAPVIFGQMNFFLEFDVCFYRSQGIFEVQAKNG